MVNHLFAIVMVRVRDEAAALRREQCIGLGVVIASIDHIFRGTGACLLEAFLASRLPTFPDVTELLTGTFFQVFQQTQLGHQFHKDLDRLQFCGFLCIGWEFFVQRFVLNPVQYLRDGTLRLHYQRWDAVVVNRHTDWLIKAIWVKRLRIGGKVVRVDAGMVVLLHHQHRSFLLQRNLGEVVLHDESRGGGHGSDERVYRRTD